MTIITVGIAPAKNVLVAHDGNETGKAERGKPQAARDQCLGLIARLPPRMISRETGSGRINSARHDCF